MGAAIVAMGKAAAAKMAQGIATKVGEKIAQGVATKVGAKMAGGGGGGTATSQAQGESQSTPDVKVAVDDTTNIATDAPSDAGASQSTPSFKERMSEVAGNDYDAYKDRLTQKVGQAWQNVSNPMDTVARKWRQAVDNLENGKATGEFTRNAYENSLKEEEELKRRFFSSNG